MNITDSPTSRVLPVRSEAIVAVIVHTTGDTDLTKILAFYHDLDGFQPHYMIDYGGTIYRIVKEDHVAYHAKIEPAEARLYQQGYTEWCHWVWHGGDPMDVGQEATNYVQWRETWEPKQIGSPLGLVTGNHPNGRSIGIELQQPIEPGDDIFTDEQYIALGELTSDIGKRLKIVLSRESVLGHYDVSPLRRSSSRGNWDPGAKFSFNRLFDLL